MHDQPKQVVINTTPLIALNAATGNLDVLRCLYSKVIVPYEVAEEIRAGGRDSFGVDVFDQASWLSSVLSTSLPLSTQHSALRFRSALSTQHFLSQHSALEFLSNQQTANCQLPTADCRLFFLRSAPKNSRVIN